jgi:diguanylate cyclase (GGDEF)-like protein
MEILIVGDDLVAINFIQSILKNIGYKVLVAEDGHRALALIQKKRIRMVVSDWTMLSMSGLELCRAIRENQSLEYIFIIILTNKNSKDDIIAGLEAGADNFLCKPFNRDELNARLNAGIRILDLETSLKNKTKEIKIVSITDFLTGCYNRGYLAERLPQEIKRARRYGHSLSLVFCDIDHFKQINDTYGHPAGDQVLKAFVKCISKSVREGVDWLARYGGEEFFIVLPETDTKGACCMAERLRNIISQKVFYVKEKKIHITSSFGVTGFDSTTPDEKISPEAMIEQADKYLYQSKQEGRNRINVGHL